MKKVKKNQSNSKISKKTRKKNLYIQEFEKGNSINGKHIFYINTSILKFLEQSKSLAYFVGSPEQDPFIYHMHTIPAGEIFYLLCNNRPVCSASFIDEYIYTNGKYITRDVKIISRDPDIPSYMKVSKGKNSSKDNVSTNTKQPNKINPSKQQNASKQSKKQDMAFKTYYKYDDDSVRVVKTNTISSDAFKLIERNQTLKNIQLIKGSHNHATLHHEIYNIDREVVYFDKAKKKYVTYKLGVHYCKKCKKFFDFYHSFMNQLEQCNIPAHRLLLNMYNDNDKKIHFNEYELRSESKLFMLGYSVGSHGLSTYGRQNVLDKIVAHKLMDAAEIKSHLEFLIRFQGSNPNMQNARKQWEQDIQYINKKIAKGQYK